VLERQKDRTKTPYSLDINLITTRPSIANNRSEYAPLKSCTKRHRHFKDFVDFQSRPSQLRCRVLHTFSSTISTGKKEKTEVGDEDGEGVKKNPEQICPYFSGVLFNSFPN